MTFADDLRYIYEREKKEYLEKQKIQPPEYEFETFEEWKKTRGYINY